MAIFCIPKKDVEKLKESALKKQVDISKLYKMSSAERRKFFAEYTDEALAKLLNTEFEKAMVSKQKAALTDWAKSVFTPKAQLDPQFKTLTDKIKALDEMGVLTPATEKAFLEDLVADKLGVNVSPEEVRIISEKAKKIETAQAKVGEDLGNPFKVEENLEFFKAKKEMDDYLQELNPSSNLRVLTGTIGRAMMLASVKSPVLNIGSNIEVGFTEALARRLSNGQFKGGNNKLAVDFVKMANRIYQETGYDISRMLTLADSGASGGRVLGDMVHAQGKGVIRRVGQAVEDVVFKQLMGAPDVAFGSAHFADSVNLNAMKMAKGDKALATEIMIDAMRLVPQTPKGEIARAQGIMDAQKATWTNESWASKTSEGIRKLINDVTGDLRIGDYVMPFVKTPANVIATGLEYAGGGALRGLVQTVRAIKAGKVGTREHWRDITAGLIRSGLGLTGAAIIAANLDDDDFVGAYDPKRAQIEGLRNSRENSIRIGGKWISVDWLGPLGVPLTGMMYARQYGGDGAEDSFQYGASALSVVRDLPGFELASDAAGSSYEKGKSLGEMSSEAFDKFTSEVYTRLVPSLLGDIAQATDSKERKTNGKVDKIKAKIPGLRQQLPVKTNVFGEDLQGEGAVSDILFGSRVRTSRETPLIKELSEVQKATDKSLNFTDWDKTNNASLIQFKDKVGEDKYNEAKVEYGTKLKAKLEKTISTTKYQKMDMDEKLKAITSLDTEAMKEVFSKYHFTYKKEKELSNSQKSAGERSIIDLVVDYSKAYQTDPANAFKAMFTGEELGKVEGNLVQLERFKGVDFKAKGGSEEVMKQMLKEAGIPWEQRQEYNLEHIVPVSSGGGTESENLYPEKRSVHNSYTPLDTLAGKLMESRRATRQQITEIMRKLKVERSITIAQAKELLDNYK